MVVKWRGCNEIMLCNEIPLRNEIPSRWRIQHDNLTRVFFEFSL